MFSKLRGVGANLKQWVWLTELTDLPGWRIRIIKMSRVAFAVVRDVAEGQLTLRAMSLVYTTLLSLVPLLAVSFSVLKAFGVHNQLEPMLLNFLAPLGDEATTITTNILSFVERMKVGLLGAAGLAILIYTVIALMQKIESAFNYTWRVPNTRPLYQRFSDYLSVLLIGPVLVFAALALTGALMNNSAVEWLSQFSLLGKLFYVISRLLPYLMIIGAFAFIYIFIPNTQVKLSAALAGAVVSGVLWKAVGYIFASFVVFGTYTVIYSAFASLIFFLIWLYLGWLILLVGASIAFYVQNPDYVLSPRREILLSNHTKERLALLLMAHIARRFYQGERATGAKDLALKLRTPSGLIEQTLAALEQQGLIKQTNDKTAQFLPARPLEETKVQSVLQAIRHAEENLFIYPYKQVEDAEVDRIFDHVEQSIEQSLEGLTVKDLALGRRPESLTALPENKKSR